MKEPEKMFKKLAVKIAKKFMPKPETLAEFAAKKIQAAINESGREDQIAKYGSLADAATEIQKFVTSILKDGKIDDLETDEIKRKLSPLFRKICEVI